MILVGVFAVANGRGGELAYEHADHAPLDLGPVSATDVALLRPPTALWGYNMQVTDEALDRIARSIRDRDIEIASLQRQLADMVHGQAGRFEDTRDDLGPLLGSEQAGSEQVDSEQVDSEQADPGEAGPADPGEAAAEEQGW